MIFKRDLLDRIKNLEELCENFSTRLYKLENPPQLKVGEKCKQGIVVLIRYSRYHGWLYDIYNDTSKAMSTLTWEEIKK